MLSPQPVSGTGVLSKVSDQGLNPTAAHKDWVGLMFWGSFVLAFSLLDYVFLRKSSINMNCTAVW